MTTVSNALIVTLGGVGYQMAQKYADQLKRRHPGITLPSIQIMPLLEEDSRSAESHPLPAIGMSFRGNDPNIRPIAQHLFPHTTFPENQTEFGALLASNPRLRGQIALFYHIYVISERLRAARRAIFSSQTLDTLSQNGIRIANPRRIQVYLLASLSDGFMSGLLPDLPYIIQHVLKEAAPEDTFVNINLVFAMPGFNGEVREVTDNTHHHDFARLRLEVQRDVNATAAATLREIDYYLAGSHHYSRQFSQEMRIEDDHNPLGEGRIFLLESTNEEEKTLDDVNAMTSMVGDWLFNTTTTALREQVETPQILPAGQAYSSFGLSSVAIPMSRWIERVTVRQQIDLITDMLAAGSVEEQDISAARAQLHLTEEELRDRITERTSYSDIRLQPMQFRNVPLASAQQFLQRVQSKYNEMMTTRLPETLADMHYRKRQLTSKHNDIDITVIDDAEAHVLRLLDEPRGGIIKAHIFLEALRDDLQRDRDRIAQERESRRNSAEKMQRRIDSQRSLYLGKASAADGPGGLPFLWLAGLLVLGLIPLGGVLVDWISNGRGIGNWLMLVIMLGLTVFIIARAVNGLNKARYRVVKSYDERLQAFRESDMQEALGQMYDELIQWTGNFRQGVNDIWESLTDIRTRRTAEWERLSNPKDLCGLSAERLSEYLLTPAAITQAEKHLPLHNFAEQSEALRQEVGTPSQWLTSASKSDALSGSIESFCRKRVERELSRYDLREALRNIPEHELLGKFQRVYQLSRPFWRHDPTRVGNLEAPDQVVGMPNLQLDTDRLFGASLQRIELQSPYEIVVSGLRHGFGLHEMNSFTQVLGRAYEQVARRDLHLIHTTEDRAALPDPGVSVPQDIVIRNMPSRQLYAVACALGVVGQSETTGNGNGAKPSSKIVFNRNGRSLVIGENPVEAVSRLDRDKTLVTAVRDDVASQWTTETTPARIRNWSQRAQPGSTWVLLAARDFLDEIDEDNPLIAVGS